ncbi:MAG: hypothetical protein HY301_20430 [Verrucomicrobia bacterium]|nr:hypothetical protein [Verrucomicrobiota bacterium]
MSRRQKTIAIAIGATVLVWALALTGRLLVKNAEVTREKLAAYMRATDPGKLSDKDRAAALRKLAAMVNAMSFEERRSARLSGEMTLWIQKLTEEEKLQFLEMTMPTGFKRMITAFEELPEQKRKKAIDDSFKRIREAAAEARDPGAAFLSQPGQETNAPVVSDEVRQKVLNVGLNTFFKESSAQTKAEVMPLLEELQRAMQRGAGIR